MTLAGEQYFSGTYEAARRKKPPQDPLARGTNWPAVIGWGLATAVVATLVQVAAQRGAAGLFEQVTGHRPPRG